MRYCKIRSCDNFKGVANSVVHMFRYVTRKIAKLITNGVFEFFFFNLNIYLRTYNSTPKDAAHQMAWENALRGQECGSSDYVCLEHFTSSDYNVSSDGKRYSLRAGAIPTIFEVFLIEVIGDNDDSAFDENSNNTFDSVSINHKKLHD